MSGELSVSACENQLARDREVESLARGLVDQLARGLLHAIMDEVEPEPVARARALEPVVGVAGPDEAVVDGDGDRLGHALGAEAGGEHHRFAIEALAEQRRRGQDQLRVLALPLESLLQQRDHVRGRREAVEHARVAGPSQAVTIEAQRPAGRGLLDDLRDEERVAPGLLEHRRHEVLDLVDGLIQARAEPPGEVVGAQRSEVDGLGARAALDDRRDRGLERVAAVDLGVSPRADQQEMGQVRVAKQGLDDPQRRRVGPLQIVEEQDQRLSLGRDAADRPTDGVVEPGLREGGRDVGDARLRTEQLGQPRRDVDQQLGVGRDVFEDPVPPSLDLLGPTAEHVVGEALQDVGQGPEREIARVLIELALDDAATGDRHLGEQLADQGGLADAGLAGDPGDASTTGPHALERGEQRGALGFATDEILRQGGLVADHAGAQGDGVPRLERREDPTQIDGEPGRALVAVLGALVEQGHHQIDGDLGDPRDHRAQTFGPPGQVGVGVAEAVVADERRRSSKQLVERRAQGIEIRANVDPPVHAPGLLGREIPRRALEAVDGDRLRATSRGWGREPEVDQPDLAGLGMHDDVRRADVAVQDAALVDLGQGLRCTEGDPQGAARLASDSARSARPAARRRHPRARAERPGRPGRRPLRCAGLEALRVRRRARAGHARARVVGMRSCPPQSRGSA